MFLVFLNRYTNHTFKFDNGNLAFSATQCLVHVVCMHMQSAERHFCMVCAVYDGQDPDPTCVQSPKSHLRAWAVASIIFDIQGRIWRLPLENGNVAIISESLADYAVNSQAIANLCQTFNHLCMHCQHACMHMYSVCTHLI